jgi:hypothetical protein
VITLNAHRHGGAPTGICVATVRSNGGGGGCSPYPQLFATSPISVGSFGGGAQQFLDAAGVVSDAVVRLHALLANGQSLNVPLKDNAYEIQLPLAHLPARLVGYDHQGGVVGVSDKIEGSAAPGQPKRAAKQSNCSQSQALTAPTVSCSSDPPAAADSACTSSTTSPGMSPV